MIKYIKAKVKSLLSIIKANKSIQVSEFEKKLQTVSSLPRYKPGYIEVMGKKIKYCDGVTFVASYREIFIEKIYDFNTENIQPVFIDCGANIGLATLYLKLKYPKAKIFSFEPDPNLYEALVYNVSTTDDISEVICYNNPISNSKDKIKFHQEGGHSGMIVEKTGVNVIELESIRLKDLLENFQHVDFLKIDIEGHENKVLPDIQGHLHKVSKIFIEYHSFVDKPQELEVLLKILKEEGFRYYVKEAYNKKYPFLQKEIFLGMDLLVNIFCYKD